MAEPKRRTVYKAKYTGKVYNTAREAAIDNRNFLTAQQLAEQTRRIPATYIGGNTNKARATFWKQEPVIQHAVDSIANRYGIDSSALKYRLDKEGFVDGQIKVRNNPNFESYRGYDLLHTMNTISGVEHFGLDDVATLIEQGKVKPINEEWWDVDFTNEKGRQTHGAHGKTVADNIGLMAATLKYFTDEAKKDNPNLSNYDANRYGLAYYNRGVSGGRNWVDSGAKGYDYKNNKFKKGGTMAKRSLEYAGKLDDINIVPVDNTRVATPVVNYQVERPFFKPYDRYLYDDVFTDADAIPYKLTERDNFVFDKHYLTPNEIKEFTKAKKQQEILNALRRTKRENGGIHIAPSKRGTFTAAATKHGMSVQGFASKVLANKENYSSAMVKKANFAKNASKWNH